MFPEASSAGVEASTGAFRSKAEVSPGKIGSAPLLLSGKIPLVNVRQLNALSPELWAERVAERNDAIGRNKGCRRTNRRIRQCRRKLTNRIVRREVFVSQYGEVMRQH